MKNKNTSTVWLVGLVLLAAVVPALAQEEPPLIPGTVEGTGTFFEVSDSEYLNVTLESSEVVTLRLESFPEMVLMHLEAAEGAASSLITLAGLVPSTTYYFYEDGYSNGAAVTTDGDGRYSFVQDLSEAHTVIIQPNPGTKIIRRDSTGGDCPSIGTWDWGTKTCTLNRNVYGETIELDGYGLTLDGNGYRVRGYGTGNGVAVFRDSNVTVKNVRIEYFVHGIIMYRSHSSTISANALSNNHFNGIHLYSLTASTVIGNSVSRSRFKGISVDRGYITTISGNTVSSTHSYGNGVGIGLLLSQYTTLTGNTVSDNDRGIDLYRSSYSTLYNNNFIDNLTFQARVEQGSGNTFDEPLPVGGNYWSDWTAPDANGDGIVDQPYVFAGGADALPWIIRDGWADLESPTCSNLLVDPDLLAVGTAGLLTATIDDAGRGGSDIFSAEWSLDGGEWFDMYPVDGSLDSPTEDVFFDLTAPPSAGVYDLCARGEDVAGNVSDLECTLLVVYDPSAGFVTGGGWIDSPPGAYFPADQSLPLFDGSFYELVSSPGITWHDGMAAASEADTSLCGSPHLVTITTQEEKDFLYGHFGSALAWAWYGGFQEEGVSPADTGWQWVTGEEWGYANWCHGEPDDHTGDGSEQYLSAFMGGECWSDATAVDWQPSGYVVEYDDCPAGKANFGFVSKYKKGADLPTGNTEFRFDAAGLNFHSDSYEWLLVTGSDYARFKGVGSINGEGEYKFMLWAGDGEPDTFRIKIWTEDEETAVETVIYDNGFDQELGGGSIVIHSK